MSKVENSFATAYSKEENGQFKDSFDALVHGKWSYAQLPMVQRIMNTDEKTSTRVTPVDFILNNSIHLSNRILSPPGSVDPLSQVALSDTLNNWIARQHTLLTVAQAHQLEYDPRITEYPVHSYTTCWSPITIELEVLTCHN